MSCLICGCTDDHACADDVEGVCSWFVPWLCSFCVLGWMCPTDRAPLFDPPVEVTW